MRTRFALLLAATLAAGIHGRPAAAQNAAGGPAPRAAEAVVYDTTQVSSRQRVANAAEIAPLVSMHWTATMSGLRVAASADLEVVVGVDGTPEHVKVLGASSPAFAQGVERIGQALRFEPARRAGEPVRCRLRVPIEFNPSF